MKKLFLILSIILITAILSKESEAKRWVYITPLGITIQADKKAIPQYETYWGLSWNDIDFDHIDQYFIALQDAYGSVADPKAIVIRIKPWSPKCINAESPDQPKEFKFDGQCIDGFYNYYTNVIGIHLGDDTGQGINGWCQTALDYELGHYFLRNLGDSCWYYEFSGDCPSHYVGAWEVGLCQ